MEFHLKFIGAFRHLALYSDKALQRCVVAGRNAVQRCKYDSHGVNRQVYTA